MVRAAGARVHWFSMAVTISRLRIWFAVMAVLVMAVVAGYYLNSRLALRIALRNLPGKVGIDIQQTSEGFTLSKSDGGRTLYTIHASKATQFKQGGRAELHDVNIVVYGRKSDRFDQIYGKDFEYDQQAGTIVSKGEVHIDLQGNSEGQKLDDQAPPRETSNPIHLRTQGMVFNQKTGMAETDGVVDFRVPQASGTARGATYNSQKNELTLHSEIDIQTEGNQPTHIQAHYGTISKEPRVITMDVAKMDGEGKTMLADQAVINLAEDNSMQHVTALGNVRLSEQGGLQLRAPRGDMDLGSNNTVETALFTGGVDFQYSKDAASGHSGEMTMQFVPGKQPGTPQIAADASGGNAQLRTIYARKGVTLRQEPKAGSKSPQNLTMTSEAMTFAVKDGRLLTTGQTEGPGELVMTSMAPKNAGEKTVVDAKLFTAEFGDENRLRTVHGIGAVKVTDHLPGEPDKVSTSDTLVAEFTPSGEIFRAVQEGDFRYKEGQRSKDEPGGRTSTAQRAYFSPQDNSLTLVGDPRVVDGGMTVTADNIRLLRQSGEAFATGNVKSTYSELTVQPNGALLATADPVHVTSQAMNAKQASGLAHYTGGARLWQASNIVEAPTIDFDQHARTIVAQGERKHPVTSIFLQVDDKGKSTTMLVTAPQLHYSDNDRQARYFGGVTARSEDGVMTADHADIYLNAASKTRTAGPSQLDHIVASDRVLVQQQERRAEGEKLVYTAANSTFVMTGGSPMLSDPVNGTVRGDSLTFYSHDDRVVVEGRGSSRAVTHTFISH